ncbi:MAG: hypothetical protein U0792_00205 [Gemmataceae bacterium]
MKGGDSLPILTEGAALDGAAGNLASIRFDRPADVERFAQQPDVLSVRLPRQASETVLPIPAGGKPATAADVLNASGVEALHRLGYTGAGVKVLVVGSDFTGADKLIGKGLPKKTQFLDLTTELNPEIVPSPADPTRAGNGTAAALAFAMAAPDSELVLVRIDPGAIFQLFGILQVVRKEATYSNALRSRLIDISNRTVELTRRKEIVVNEYRLAFEDLADDEATKARRVRAKAALDIVLADQVALTQRIDRFNAFQKEVVSKLVGARVIVNTLEWESGYPLDAMSQLSRTLEQIAVALPPRVVKRAGDLAAAPPPPLVWIQAASAAGPTVWGGPFLDPNSDSSMEFAAPHQPLPPMNWSADMNFLGFQPASGEVTPELPAGAKLRVTMQWREPTDPTFPSVDRPMYPVVLRLFRQLDPKGEKIPSDEMAEEARSAGGPYPLLFTKTYVVFEQVVEFTAKEPGRYALVVAKGYEPEAAPTWAKAKDRGSSPNRGRDSLRKAGRRAGRVPFVCDAGSGGRHPGRLRGCYHHRRAREGRTTGWRDGAGPTWEARPVRAGFPGSSGNLSSRSWPGDGLRGRNGGGARSSGFRGLESVQERRLPVREDGDRARELAENREADHKTVTRGGR